MASIDARIADVEAGILGLREQMETFRHQLSANEGALLVLRELKSEADELAAEEPDVTR